MTASIAFTDTIGAATLENGLPAPGDRLRGWLPLATVIGPRKEALGTGIPYTFVFRSDYGAKFTMAYLPNSVQSVAARLIRHLLGGGSVTVDTGDGTHVYSTCYLWPGSTPELSPPDPKDLRRTFTVSLLNADAADMLTDYA